MNQTQFQSLAAQYTAIPVSRVMMADTVTPVSLFLSIRKGAAFPFLLESVEGGEQIARYSFLGRNPYQLLKYYRNKVTLVRYHNENKTAGSNHEVVSTESMPEDDCFDVLRRLCLVHREPRLPDMPRLTGGAVGFSSYDTVRLMEHLPDAPPGDLDLPDAMWAFYDEVFAFDHVKHRVILIKTVFTDPGKDHHEQYHQAQRALDTMENLFHTPVSDSGFFRMTSSDLRSNLDRDYYYQCVEKARHYITRGDIFQVVLSQRFQSSYTGDRFMLYRMLRMINPSPYLFYLDYESFALIGSSPEVLVQVQDDMVRVLPIAGTRPRGKTIEEDLAYEKDLMSDPKELAEHIMLVDLGRNDLSRVCDPGTVKMNRDRITERFSHVMHIVSDISGKLAGNMTAVDALTHCFPAGTVSGAPKVRAMQIIDELEPVRRGPYSGAVGYFDFTGNMDTCIAIRTMVATSDKVYIQAGAGIVADSVPEREYDETVNKAQALVEALNMAQETFKEK